jgi:hypothetical protein
MRRVARILTFALLIPLALVGVVVVGLLLTGLVVRATDPVAPPVIGQATDHTHSAQLSVSQDRYSLDRTISGTITVNGTPGALCTVTIGGPVVFRPVSIQAGIDEKGQVQVTNQHLRAVVAARPTSTRATITTNCGQGNYTTDLDFNV